MARHPLQRFESPARSLSAIVHLGGIAAFLASFRWLVMFPNPMHEAFGGNFQFLTIIGLTLALLTFIFGFLADIFLSPELFQAKNVLSVCSAPLEVLISILYWGLSAVDKRLVIPEEFQLPFIPDFGFHGMPAVMLTLDLLLFSPPWTVNGYSAMALSTFLAFSYWGWVEYCFTKNGWYPYPIFELLSTTQRVLLYAVAATLMTGSTLALKWGYGKLNGIEEFKKEAIHPLKAE